MAVPEYGGMIRSRRPIRVTETTMVQKDLKKIPKEERTVEGLVRESGGKWMYPIYIVRVELSGPTPVQLICDTKTNQTTKLLVSFSL
jgi:hypothetical protein